MFGHRHLRGYDSQYETCAAVIRAFRCLPYNNHDNEEMIRTISCDQIFCLFCVRRLVFTYFTTPVYWCVLYFMIIIIIATCVFLLQLLIQNLVVAEGLSTLHYVVVRKACSQISLSPK